jgi:hypothetical protein
MNKPLSTTCEHCNKSGLSLLLLRPSPVSTHAELAPLGSGAVITASMLDAKVLPTRQPTQSRTALRLLRNGYVHVFIPAPPPGVPQWLHHRVSDNADLYLQGNPEFDKSSHVVCKLPHHNALGMRLLHIPQAHKIAAVWIAFSANLWTDTLKARNAANAKAMQLVSLRSSSGVNEILQPTGQMLSQHVLEFALPRLSTAGVTQHDFPFASLAGSADSMAEQMRRAAECHPQTKAHEKAVVLADPVGYATELNGIRLLRNELIKAEMAKPENLHALNSISLADGMQRQLIDAQSIDSYTAVSPMRFKDAFDPADYPAGTEWQPLTPQDRELLIKSTGDSAFTTPYRNAFKRSDLGRVIYPDHDERMARWSREQADKTWSKIADEFDAGERDSWLSAFEAKMKNQHMQPQELTELDWWAACKDVLYKNYFELHFDEADPNKLIASHSPGMIYTREVALSTTPAPMSRGPVLTDYLAQLMADPSQTDAVMLRALVANQKELVATVKQALEPSGAGKQLHENRNDKLYDLGNGMAQGLLAKYRWASMGMGVLTGGYSLLVSQSLIAAAMVPVAASMGSLMPAAAGAVTGAGLSAQDMARLARSLSVQMVQSTVTMAMESMADGKGPNTPVLITRDINISTVLRLMAGDASPKAVELAEQMERLRRGQRTIRISVLTDSHTLAQSAGDLKPIIKANPSAVGVGKAARAEQAGGVAAGTAAMSQTQFNALFKANAGVAERAAQAVRDTAQGGRAVIGSLGGQLAMGSVLINGVGLLGSIATISNSQDAQAVRYAWYGLYDNAAGVLGGLVEVLAIGATAQALSRAPVGTSATAATAQSRLVTGLRVTGAMLGSVAGVANALANWARAGDAKSKGDLEVMHLYRASAAAFFGAATTGAAYGAGAVANRLVARGVGGAMVRTISLRLGTAAAATALTGWGLVLVGAGLVFEGVAVMLTPSELEKWARKSRFGKLRGERFSSWSAELAQLEKVLKASNEAVKESAK